MTISPSETVQGDRKARIMAGLADHPFRAAWWLRNRHLQTAWGPLFRRQHAIPMRREVWDTPDDDRLVVYFRDGEPDKPTVLLLHGLEGCIESNYLGGYTRRFSALGWSVVVMTYRSCGGEMNVQPRMYHAGETGDVAFVVDRLVAANPDGRLFIVGFSLGGNILAKWLGEAPDRVPSNVCAAAAISAPYDLPTSGPYFDKVLGGAYARYFLKKLIPKAIEKHRQFPGRFDLERVRYAKTLYEYDEHATAPLHGFRDAMDYWSKSSCKPHLMGIRVPLLLLSAVDDPFFPPETLPRKEADASPWLHPLFTDRGGHVGHVAGSLPWRPRYWSEEQTDRFFRFYAP